MVYLVGIFFHYFTNKYPFSLIDWYFYTSILPTFLLGFFFSWFFPLLSYQSICLFLLLVGMPPYDTPNLSYQKRDKLVRLSFLQPTSRFYPYANITSTTPNLCGSSTNWNLLQFSFALHHIKHTKCRNKKFCYQHCKPNTVRSKDHREEHNRRTTNNKTSCQRCNHRNI